jgi:transposase-like protein
VNCDYLAGMAKMVTCPQCGALYERTEVKLIVRDRDDFQCSCGKTLESWNQSRIPQYRLVKKAVDK